MIIVDVAWNLPSPPSPLSLGERGSKVRCKYFLVPLSLRERG